MRPDELLKVGELGELALADLATVRLDPEVDSRVLRKVGAVGKGLVARCTLVRLGLAHVDLRVKLKICFRRKYLKALLSVLIFFSRKLFSILWYSYSDF